MDNRQTLLARVRQYIAQHIPLTPQQLVLVGLSGGADSVALLSILTSLGYRCEACHCNFQLRGPEAEEDEPYLRDLIGLSVRLEDGTLVGRLEDVDFPAGQEMWSIRAPEDQGGYEILFPAVPEFVLDIDLSAETVTIAPPEGLLDLYREGASSVPDDGDEDADQEERSPRRS